MPSSVATCTKCIAIAAIDMMSLQLKSMFSVRGSFVTKLERGGAYWEDREPLPSVPDLTYPVDGDRTLTVPGPIREACHEVLFEKDNDRLSLPHMILDAIEKVLWSLL